MVVAWLITIAVFLICIYATNVIINGLKEKDQYDLDQLQSQFKNKTNKDNKDRKLVV